jgi:hypothetical protein
MWAINILYKFVRCKKTNKNHICHFGLVFFEIFLEYFEKNNKKILWPKKMLHYILCKYMFKEFPPNMACSNNIGKKSL